MSINNKKNWRFYNKKLASLSLAVFILISLAVISAVGTIIESKYDATAASKWVYRTPWMMAVMVLLAVNLTAVMIDRWPWKKRHIPFLLAHIGIIILQVGALLSMKWGLDGTIRFGIGEKNRLVTLPETDVTVWASFDGQKYTKSFESEVDFFLKSPAKKSFEIPTLNGVIRITDYWPYAIGSSRIESVDDNPQAMPALQVTIKNPKVGVNQTIWLQLNKKSPAVSQQMGPLKLTLASEYSATSLGVNLSNDLVNPERSNQVIFVPNFNKKNADGLFAVDIYLINKDIKKPTLKKTVFEGQPVVTEWMGMEITPFKVIEKSETKWHFKQLTAPTPMSTSVVKVEFEGKKQWIQQNDIVKFFAKDSVYILSYGNRRQDIGFDLQLNKFEVGRYQGTMRAASYQSRVLTPDLKEHLISMNEPLKYQGLTFYQASFEDGPEGKPVASVLSVNYDPGRFLKYLGSLILSLGIVWLFYDKRKAARSRAPKDGAIV